MAIRLKSTGKVNPLRYGRGEYGPQEEFAAADVDARLAHTLVKTGLATRVIDNGEAQVTAYETRDQTAAPIESTQVVAYETRDQTAEAPKRKRGRPPKGAYLRRDMRAED